VSLSKRICDSGLTYVTVLSGDEEPESKFFKNLIAIKQRRERNPLLTKVESIIDLKALENAFDKGEQDLIGQLQKLRQKLLDDALEGIIELSPADYHTLVVDPPAASRAAFRDELIRIYDEGRKLVLDELAAQGGTDLGELQDLDDDDLAYLDEVSDLTVSKVANDVQSRVIGLAGSLALLGLTGAVLQSRLGDEFNDSSTAYLDSTAAGANHAVMGAGRSSGAEDLSDAISSVYYSSVLDDSSCTICSDADGETGAIDADITPAPNPDCDGGIRCRCVHLYVLADEEKQLKFNENHDEQGRFSSGDGGGSTKNRIEEVNRADFNSVRKELRVYYKEEFENLKGKGLATADEFNEVPKIGQAAYMMDAAIISADHDGASKLLIIRDSNEKIVAALNYIEDKSTLRVPFMGSTSPLGGFKLFKNVLNVAVQKEVGLSWTSAQSKNAEAFWKKTGFPYKDSGIGLKFSLSSDQVKSLVSGKFKLKATAEIEAKWPVKHWPGAFIGLLPNNLNDEKSFKFNENRDERGRFSSGNSGPQSFTSDADGKAFIDKTYGDWKKSLSGKEDAAFAFYQSPGYELMNGQARGLKVEAPAADLKRAKQAIKDFDSAIEKSPGLPHDLIVYRGLNADQFGAVKEGDILTDKGFTSVSLTTGSGTGGKNQAKATIRLPAGTKAAAGRTKELVLARGTQFIVKSYSKVGRKVSYELEVIGD